MKKTVLVGLVFLLLTITALAVPAPQTEVETMVNSVLSVMQNETLSLAEKKAQVSGRVQSFLNVESMSQRTLGDHWAQATPEQRDYFSGLFVKVLEATYLNRTEDYSDGVVHYQQQRVKGDKAIIDTVITSKELEIPVQYKMIFANGSWQVFDLVIEGVSLVRNYRASYGEIIRKEGFAGLFALMEKKVNELNGVETVQ